MAHELSQMHLSSRQENKNLNLKEEVRDSSSFWILEQID